LILSVGVIPRDALGASLIFSIFQRIGKEFNMTQPLEKADQTNCSEPDGALNLFSDRTDEQLLFTATELCLLYLQCEKLLKKQEIVLGGCPEDVC